MILYLFIVLKVETRNLTKAAVLIRHGARNQLGNAIPNGTKPYGVLTSVGMR